MHFANTIMQISSSDSVSLSRGISRHICWQFRCLFRVFPVELTIGTSCMIADRPNGVAALVNCMGMYDFNNMTLIQRVLDATKGVFFDVGANIGAYTLIASEIPGATVVSIEPHPESYRLLRNNVRLNHRHNVTCVNAAASDCEGTLVLSSGSELSTNSVMDGRTPGNKAVMVNSTTLAKLCDDLKLQPTIMKIDVEGHELFVLSGYSNFKGTSAIIIENGERREIQNMLHTAGYLGPLYYHAAMRDFSTQRQRRAEDAVYIRQISLETWRLFV